MVKVAINGFGRIGRLAFRQMFGAEGYEVVAINDLTSPKMLAHLLKYDSSQGKYALADTVSYKENEGAAGGSITVDGKEITIYAEPKAENLPWGELGVDVVLECTGFYTSKERLRLISRRAHARLLFPPPQATIFPPLFTMLTIRSLRQRTPLFRPLPAPPTASLPWPRLLTISLPS